MRYPAYIAHIIMLAIAFIGFSGDAMGQVYNMTNGTVSTCTGSFQDDGTGGGPYSNSSYTFTICPDNPGDVIQVDFVAFGMYTSPNPNNSDYLQIYDGNSTAANSLGSYTGTSLQGLPVTGTVNNPTGCLTFVFNPNPNTPGTFPGWEALISCTTPCAPPTALLQFVNPLPQGQAPSIGVCLGQVITFADAGSFAETGFFLETYEWNWGDGTTTALTGPSQVTHSYDEPGEYIVTLSVYDNNGCRNLNLEPLQVLVSTIPIFNTAYITPVCVGTVAPINGNPIQSVTWTALPPQVVAGETFLADGAGFAYSTSLIFDFFEPGATLESCDDFQQVFVNMEHSYMGDLGISLTCPNGTVVNIMTYPNGGGATYLGEAVDDNFDPLAPGIGYTYGWSPTSTNGFINQAANWTMTTFTNAVGGVDVNNIANPGVYQSQDNLCNFVGCPLNGEWTFSITDNLALDNGYIFYWGIDFNPLLFPDVTTFTPVVGLGLDSTYWTGPNIVNTSANGNLIEVLHSTPGFYDYTFYATNNFGCTFDTTVTLEVIQGPAVTAGPDLIVCNTPEILQAGIAGSENASCNGSAGTFSYCYGNNANLVITYCPDNPGDGVTFMEFNITQGSVENFWDNFYVFDGNSTAAPLIAGPLTGNLVGQSFAATNPTGCITWQITSDGSVSCQQSAFIQDLIVNVTCLGGGGLVWSWSPPTGLSNPNIQNPTVLVEQTTVYTVSAYPPQYPGCVVTDQVIVSPDPSANPGLNTDTVFCYNSPQSTLLAYLKGTPAPGGFFTNNATGQPVPNNFSPLDYPDGLTLSLTYTVTNGICVGNSVLNIIVLPATNPTCCQTNAVAGEDAIPCSLTYMLQAEPVVGLGTWTGPPNVTFSDIHNPNATVNCTSPGGTVVLTWTDENGAFCSATDQITIYFADSLSVMVLPNDALCFNECTGTAIAIANGGTTANGAYIYEWSGGTAGVIGFVQEGLCPDVNWVKVIDDVGCADSVFFEIGQPLAQTILLNTIKPLCADSCDGKIFVDSPGAVSYSYDGGESWVDSPSIDKCAGNYTVLARNANGCTASGTVEIDDPPRYVALMNVNPNPTTTKNTFITFQDVSGPGTVAQSLWRFGTQPVLATSDERFASYRFPSDTSGTYPIRLISTNVNGCMDTVYKDMIIRDDLLWFIPNSFTPNGDGINDIWRPVGEALDITDYRLTIFDRWGREVFSTTDFDRGWNGGVQGSQYFVEAGLYNYLIKVSSRWTEDKYEFTGFIVLVR